MTDEGPTPGDETLAAIAESIQGDLIATGSIAQLMTDLNEDDEEPEKPNDSPGDPLD